jgi:iron(III) transport system substrate-binding protein
MRLEKPMRPGAAAALVVAALTIVHAAGCMDGPGRTFSENELVIISPHDETVRYEISRAFEAYARIKTGKSVTVRWQPARGTGNIMRFLENEMQSAAGGREVGIDVFMGGGAPAHAKAKKLGITQPVKLADHVLAAVPETLGGVHLWDPDGYWFGVTISSFGIIYNKLSLARRGLPEPDSWKDLADPAFFNLLILADPFESGSARACYEMIMQRFGWDEGWGVLLRILANAGSFTHSSSDIVREMSSGQSAAGMVIDLYAFVQIEKDGSDFIGFTLPEGETTFTPDPVSVIKGTPRKELALVFIEFLLSEEGQRLWCLPPGAEGGPGKYNLWHFPVRPDVYESAAGSMTVRGNPFLSLGSMKYDEMKGIDRARVLSLLFETAGVQNHARLKKAWKKVMGDPHGPLAEQFDEPPFTEKEGFAIASEIDDPVRAEIIEEQYYRFFKNKFLGIAGP